MLISIITATYNSGRFLEDTLRSYIEQDYQEKEWIVVDGASKDKTLKILKAHIQEINHFISEPDQGIYDALNKGIALAKGDVIGILNSDDVFAKPDVMKKV